MIWNDTDMRLEKICTLRKGDLQTHKGVPCFMVSPQPAGYHHSTCKNHPGKCHSGLDRHGAGACQNANFCQTSASPLWISTGHAERSCAVYSASSRTVCSHMDRARENVGMTITLLIIFSALFF